MAVHKAPLTPLDFRHLFAGESRLTLTITMNKFLTITLAAAMCAPAFAQKMGMSNNNAPTIKQSITAGEAKVSFDYTSITWSSGSTMNMIMDKEKGAKTRARVNATAKEQPLGAFSTSVDLMIGTKKIAAGEYTVGFTINEKLEWELNFMGKETVTLTLPLAEMKDEHKRLACTIGASDETGMFLNVCFGKKSGTLLLSPAKEEGKKG